MGILTCVESRPRLAFPGTPPELVSPSSSTYSSRSSEAAPPSPPPMSNYDRPTPPELLRGKSPEDPRQSPREQLAAQQQEQQRQQQQQIRQQPQQEHQQLPPLSSILTLSQDGRPLHSPVSEERRAFSATTSPLDRPHTSGPPHSARPYSPPSSSYFPPTAPAPPPRLRAARLEPRLDEGPARLQPLSRDPFPRPPLSPQSREGEQHYRASAAAERGSEYGPVPYQREEYSPHSYRPQHERYPPQPPPLSLLGVKREADQMGGYHRESPQQQQQQQQHHHHHYQHPQQRLPSHHGAPPPPPTPPSSSVAVTEGLPSKDGLGPKIWTGTHFLPRFVRAAEVPGEGMCYFYDDGSHCKTVIDGEQVNAHWGVTKAGKPRKRLAIACVTCREKKIKCDPDYPRCVQCEKFGRVCKFKNAPRGGNNTSPSTPPAEMDESRRLGGMVRPPTMDSARPGSTSSASVSPRTVLRPPSPEMMNPTPAKRQRLGLDHSYHTQHQQQVTASQAYSSNYTHAPQQPQYHHQPYSHHHQPPAPPHPSRGLDGPELRRSPLPLPLPLPLPQLRRDPRDGGKAMGLGWQPQPDLPRIRDDVVGRRAWQTDSYVHDPQPRIQNQHHRDTVPRSPVPNDLSPLQERERGRLGLETPAGEPPLHRPHRNSY